MTSGQGRSTTPQSLNRQPGCLQPGIGNAIFLSPHFDDVALSCGGTVARWAQAGPAPLVVTVFGGEVTDELITKFAMWKHSRWGIDNIDGVIQQRQAEEAAAAELLGYRLRWLGLPDAIYRGERYGSDQELFGTPQQTETALSDLIASEVRSLPEWTDGVSVFVPLGAGGHVDHQLTFAAGLQLAAQGASVWAYEDCPYAIHTPAGVDIRLTGVASDVGAPVLVPIAATLEQRIAAIAAYSTQVPVIFRFTTDMPGTMRQFAQRTGGEHGPAERFWPLKPTAAAQSA